MTIHTYPTTPQSIPAMASWPATRHQFEADHILALQAAQATGRPLLIRGEAGTGKSQLAHAAAAVTGRAFLPVVVATTTEASDLHWKFDAIARLADAHATANHVPPGADGARTGATGRQADSLHVRHYVQPGPLWWALDWAGALDQQKLCRHGGATSPDAPKDWTPANGLVLLIDEIDKAEPDLPNGLLEALANGAFDVPLLGRTVRQAEGAAAPQIIITTNDERELPAAFLRRCLVLTLQLPPDDAALARYLVARGELHFPKLPAQALQDAAALLVQDRQAARRQQAYLPGLAEYLDLLRAVQALGTQGLEPLKKLKQFYFEKQPLPPSLPDLPGTAD